MENNVKIRRFAYVILCLGIILIVSGSFSSFLSGLNNDHQEVLRRMDDVSSEFEAFSTNTSAFEDFRDELYNEVLGNVYYETMFETDKDVKEKVSNYENLVDQLSRGTKKLDRLCGNIYFPKSGINNMCVNYKSIYEQIVNYFVTDINIYNENIDKFNEYQKSNGSKDFVKKYKTDKKYIDYNGDKTFDGKEE